MRDLSGAGPQTHHDVDRNVGDGQSYSIPLIAIWTAGQASNNRQRKKPQYAQIRTALGTAIAIRPAAWVGNS